MCITSKNSKLTNSFSAQPQMKTFFLNNYDVYIVLRGFTYIHFLYIYAQDFTDYHSSKVKIYSEIHADNMNVIQR